ncbi:MAG: hypothetical protein RL621_28 [Bacteroidota bacterium]|jgi:hypothetical protein
MTPDEIHKHLNNSVYSGLFDLIGACIAESIRGKDSILANLSYKKLPLAINVEDLFKYSNVIKNSLLGRAYEGFLLEKMAIGVDPYGNYFYKVNRPILENNTELALIKERFFTKGKINDDILDIFRALFKGINVEISSGRCSKVMSAAPNYLQAYHSFNTIVPEYDSLENLQFYVKTDGNFNLSRTPILYNLFKNEFLIFQSDEFLYYEIIDSPFWQYIEKYKLITEIT